MQQRLTRFDNVDRLVNRECLGSLLVSLGVAAELAPPKVDLSVAKKGTADSGKGEGSRLQRTTLYKRQGPRGCCNGIFANNDSRVGM